MLVWKLLVPAALLGALLVLWAPQASATEARCPLEVSLVIDRSGSMATGGLDSAKAGSIMFLGHLRVTDDQSGVASYGTDATLDKAMDFNHPQSQQVVATLVANGMTNMAGGITHGRDDILANRRVGTRDVMVVLTDGNPNVGGSPVPVATSAKAQGIEIFVIGVGTGVNHATNMAVASDPDSFYYHFAPTIADIEAAYADVLALALDCRPLPAFIPGHNCAGRPFPFTDVSRPLLDPPVSIVESRWDWGDTTSTVYNPWQTAVDHVYPARGRYLVTLNVTDSTGRQGEVSQWIFVDACPIAEFSCIALRNPYMRIVFTDLSTDGDGDLVLWDWDLGPPGQRSGGGTFWADYPRPPQAWDVTLYVEDSHGHNDSVTHPCTPLLNLPPIIDPHPVYYVYEGDHLVFLVTGRDQDSNVTYFYWTRGPVPVTATFDEASQWFHWRPRYGERGTYDCVMFGISDYEYTDETCVTIVVLPRPEDLPPPQTDMDFDGAPDRHDNCPYNANPDQLAAEACRIRAPAADVEAGVEQPAIVTYVVEGPPDPAPTVDTDRDGLADARDNCPYVANPDQADLDRDRHGDACDADADGDGIVELDALGRSLDNCPRTPNPDQADHDGDGTGDACSPGAPASAAPRHAWPRPGDKAVDGPAAGLAMPFGLSGHASGALGLLVLALLLAGLVVLRRR